jgi:hypothetical protein
MKGHGLWMQKPVRRKHFSQSVKPWLMGDAERGFCGAIIIFQFACAEMKSDRCRREDSKRWWKPHCQWKVAGRIVKHFLLVSAV